MKKHGVLHSQLSRVIATMGHSDRMVICDSGLPIPRGSEVVDLALTKNIPRFLDTVRVVLGEAEVEKVIVASEMKTQNPKAYQGLMDLLNGTPVEEVSHEEFKQITRGGTTMAFVRTGEATPYANVILVSGVNFD